jgi:transposase
MYALMTVRGGTTKDVFRTYVVEVLAPELRAGEVVVLDNLAAHKDERARKIIEGKRAKLIFLPPDSSELNPIELAWSWVKVWLKTCRTRTEDGVNNALANAMNLLTSEFASGYIRHCGFAGQPK